MNTKTYISIALLVIPFFTFSMENAKLKPYIAALERAEATDAFVKKEILHHRKDNPGLHLTETETGIALFDLRVQSLGLLGEAKKALENAQKS